MNGTLPDASERQPALCRLLPTLWETIIGHQQPQQQSQHRQPICTLHDIVLLCEFGADAINPYAMLVLAIGAHQRSSIEDEDEMLGRQVRLLNTLRGGLEKVISTVGCHELRGYWRVCSASGPAPSLAEFFAAPPSWAANRWPHLGLARCRSSRNCLSIISRHWCRPTSQTLPIGSVACLKKERC